MRLWELLEELEVCREEGDEVFVEINDVAHQVHDVRDTSQGVIIVVDTMQEDREMR
ncbi:MAG: hypothetical protein ACYSWO_22505 [Planctomycetota bacterium]|jgi:hypothetical protein